MTYASGGLIQATDYNSLVGGNPTSTANTLNATWATGSGTAGYGQTALANVSIGNAVAASDWANLVNRTSNAAVHQGSSITSVTAPVSGGSVAYISAIPTNLSTIYTNRLNAATQGATTANTVTLGTAWNSIATFTHTVTFANGDAARYFFNSGGQLKLTCSHANNTAGINLLFNNLATSVGTIVMSAPSGSGTANISGLQYNGISKIGGGAGGAGTQINSTNGYYALSTANVNLFTLVATTGPSGYLSTFIRGIAKTNGTQGSNGDNGSVITIYTVWDEVPNGLTVGTGSTVTLTAQAPETTNIANTWGAITISGSVSAT